MGNSRKTITATPRQLESMIRLSEAIAKMRLSDTVEKRDVDEAVRLIKTAMQQSATDPMTGEIDMDLIATGQSHSSTERVNQIKLIIRKIYVSKFIRISYFNYRMTTEIEFKNQVYLTEIFTNM